MRNSDRHRVPGEQLRWSLPPEQLGFATTAEVEASAFTPGQNRAVRAMEIGLSLRGHGYNVFVAGEPGTNRRETVRHLLEEYRDGEFETEDFCYVYNFKKPDQPRLLLFPAGQGATFRDSMAAAIAKLSEGIPRIFQSQVYSKRRKARMKRYSARMEELAGGLREQAAPVGLSLVQVEVGGHAEAELLPLVEGEPMAFEDLDSKVEEAVVTEEERQKLIAARADLEEPLRAFRLSAAGLISKAEEELDDLDQQVTRPYLNFVLSTVYQSFQAVAGVTEYLREVENYLESRMVLFRGRDGKNEEADDEEAAESLQRLLVNVILENGDLVKPPVIFENNPNVTNLRGTIDREVTATGHVVSDFTHIKTGSLLSAHKGFLVLHADDFDGEGRAWSVIKRTLRTNQVQIEPDPNDPAPSHRALRPEPAPVDVKVILIGTNALYQTLLDHDSDFQKVFKIKAEFDTEMELGSQAITEYACLVRSVSDEDSLPHVRADGVSAIIEYAVRLAGQRNRISTRFSEVADLVREAAFWARRSKKPAISGEDVHRAIDERRQRVNLYEEKTQRLIREGVILIDTEGEVIGQINGLAVLDIGDHKFGRPTRITASVSAGASGVVNIERQADLSGRHHDKGVLIITGFLLETFASQYPLAMTASVTLEQSYDEVDGDSASTAEVFALLSALSGLPMTQELAVTGSMNQKGQVQAVGGVNEKVEGFFDLCAARGLTGDQGVVLPAANLPHLMLRPRVVNAVQERKFHIYAISRVEEGVELVLGEPSGSRGPDGHFPTGTVFGRVEKRLRELSEASREHLPWRSPMGI